MNPAQTLGSAEHPGARRRARPGPLSLLGPGRSIHSDGPAVVHVSGGARLFTAGAYFTGQWSSDRGMPNGAHVRGADSLWVVTALLELGADNLDFVGGRALLSVEDGGALVSSTASAPRFTPRAT